MWLFFWMRVVHRHGRRCSRQRWRKKRLTVIIRWWAWRCTRCRWNIRRWFIRVGTKRCFARDRIGSYSLGWGDWMMEGRHCWVPRHTEKEENEILYEEQKISQILPVETLGEVSWAFVHWNWMTEVVPHLVQWLLVSNWRGEKVQPKSKDWFRFGLTRSMLSSTSIWFMVIR